jgi:hypothetical protein
MIWPPDHRKRKGNRADAVRHGHGRRLQVGRIVEDFGNYNAIQLHRGSLKGRSGAGLRGEPRGSRGSAITPRRSGEVIEQGRSQPSGYRQPHLLALRISWLRLVDRGFKTLNLQVEWSDLPGFNHVRSDVGGCRDVSPGSPGCRQPSCRLRADSAPRTGPVHPPSMLRKSGISAAVT